MSEIKISISYGTQNKYNLFFCPFRELALSECPFLGTRFFLIYFFFPSLCKHLCKTQCLEAVLANQSGVLFAEILAIPKQVEIVLTGLGNTRNPNSGKSRLRFLANVVPSLCN